VIISLSSSNLNRIHKVTQLQMISTPTANHPNISSAQDWSFYISLINIYIWSYNSLTITRFNLFSLRRLAVWVQFPFHLLFSLLNVLDFVLYFILAVCIEQYHYDETFFSYSYNNSFISILEMRLRIRWDQWFLQYNRGNYLRNVHVAELSTTFFWYRLTH
jgi:hypothetical protein